MGLLEQLIDIAPKTLRTARLLLMHPPAVLSALKAEAERQPDERRYFTLNGLIVLAVGLVALVFMSPETLQESGSPAVAVGTPLRESELLWDLFVFAGTFFFVGYCVSAYGGIFGGGVTLYLLFFHRAQKNQMPIGAVIRYVLYSSYFTLLLLALVALLLKSLCVLLPIGGICIFDPESTTALASRWEGSPELQMPGRDPAEGLLRWAAAAAITFPMSMLDTLGTITNNILADTWPMNPWLVFMIMPSVFLPVACIALWLSGGRVLFASGITYFGFVSATLFILGYFRWLRLAVLLFLDLLAYGAVIFFWPLLIPLLVARILWREHFRPDPALAAMRALRNRFTRRGKAAPGRGAEQPSSPPAAPAAAATARRPNAGPGSGAGPPGDRGRP